MIKSTERALRASIEHWKRLASGKRKPGEDIEPEDCALCLKFNSMKSYE